MAIVPTTSNAYIGDGTTTLFAFDFPYISGSDVVVTVDDVVTSFSFSTPSVVSVSPAPANGASVLIYRNTPSTFMEYVFSEGVPFLTRFADRNWQQLLYVLQEIYNTILGLQQLSTSTTYTLSMLSLPIGTVIDTRGCLVAGDGGHGKFKVEAASGTPDGVSRVLLHNGNHAVLLPTNGCVDLRQFGIDYSNVRFALQRANTFCAATKYKLVGSGTATMYGAMAMSAPYIDLSNFTIVLGANFVQTVAIVYSPDPSAIDSTAHVSLRFDGNRDNQTQSICALRVNSCATPDQLFHVYGKNCGTLLDNNGNIERGEFHVKGVNTDCIVLESGSSPDTNRYYISGGNYKRAYWKSVTTTSQVVLNCQTQDPTSTDYAIEINGGRATTISGELRIVTKGFRIGGYTQQSIDYLHFNNFEIIAYVGSGVIFDIELANHVSGYVKTTAGNSTGQPFKFGTVSSGNLHTYIGDSTYTGNLVTFGDAANGRATMGKFSITGRSIQASAVIAHFDSVGDIDVSFYGSVIPITVASTVNDDVVNLDLQPQYISSNIAINTNSRRVNGVVRGIHAKAAILAYSTPFRGMRCINVDSNNYAFYGGANWQRVTTSTLV
jgi:hypothetical protein